MLTAVKNQCKVTFLSIKYALSKEMLNSFTFISNIIFMVLNNASFIVQWIILYSLKENVGGYTFKQILLLWGLAALTYGISHFFFKDSYNLSEIINKGMLDNYLLQPKNVLLNCITSNVEVSAIGDIIYAYIMLILYGLSFKNFCLYTFLGILGALVLTSISIIFSSLSFWFNRVEILANTVNSLMTNYATYPDGIFKGITKFLLYTLIPVGFVNFIPLKIISHFRLELFILLIAFATFIITLAIYVFSKGLERYSSTNLMNARI